MQYWQRGDRLLIGKGNKAELGTYISYEAFEGEVYTNYNYYGVSGNPQIAQKYFHYLENIDAKIRGVSHNFDDYVYIIKAEAETHQGASTPYHIGGGSSAKAQVRLAMTLSDSEKIKKRYFPNGQIHKFKLTEIL